MSEAARPIDPEELLSHVARLRALARHLVADEGRADDVVQQALLVAMERSPRVGVSFGPWLVGVVRNLARRTYRAESRRRRHEAGARPRADAASPDELAARSEALRNLADAVHRLDPACRDVVVLHYFDGLTMREVAERLDAPLETVRTRLKRALAQLRERLDAEHGGDGRAWSAALLPLAIGGGLSTKSALIQGGLAVTAKTKASLVAAAVLLVALTVSVFVIGGDDEPPPVTTAAAPASVERGAVVEERQMPAPQPVIEPVASPAPVAVAPHVEPQPVPVSKPEPIVVAEPVGTAIVHGAVRLASTKKPVVGQKVVIESPGRPAAETATDRLGRFRFEHLMEGRTWRVRVDAATFASVVVPNLHLERDELRDVGTLWLEPPCRLGVVVKDWRDRPIAGARVEAHRSVRAEISDTWSHMTPFRHVPESVAATVTGADGRAVLATLPHGDWMVVARAAGFAAAWEQSVSLDVGATKHEVTFRLDRALRIEGRVVTGKGSPVPHAIVWASGDKWLTLGSFLFPHSTTDDSGAFVLDDVLAGDVTLLVGRDGGVPAEVAKVRVPPSGPVEIVLDGGIVEGIVTSADDRAPLVGARVLAQFWDRGSWFAEAITGDDGRYRLDSMRAGKLGIVRVERQGYVTHREKTTDEPLVGAGGRVVHDVTVQRGVPLAGLVASPECPIAGARVVATWVDRSGRGERSMRPTQQSETYTDGDGRFSLPCVPPKTLVVQVFAEGWYAEGLDDFNWHSDLMNGRKPARSIDVPPAGRTDLKIVLKPGCVVSGRVESAAGAPVAGAEVRCGWTNTSTGDDGAFRLTAAVSRPEAPVTAGSGYAWVSQDVRLSSGGRVDGLVLRLPRSARVSGRVATATGAAADGASVEIVFEPAKPVSGMKDWVIARAPVSEGGRYEAEFAEREGRIFVRASAPGFAAALSARTVVESGRATYQADLLLGPSLSLEGRVVSSAGAPIAGAKIALLPGDWIVQAQDSRVVPLAAVTDREGRFRITDVAVGDVHVRVDADGFVRSTTRVKVPASGELVMELEPSLEMAGIVKLSDGTAATGVWIALRRENDSSHEFAASIRSDSDGRFRIAGLARGTYTVMAHVYPTAGNTLSVRPFEMTGVPAGRTDVEVVLQSAGEIAGCVVGPDGRPVVGSNIRATSDTGDPYSPSAFSDEDGTFVIRGIGVGTYHLDAKPPDPNHGPYLAPNVPMRPGRVTGLSAGAKDVEIRMPGAHSIKGTLFGANGKPLANASVRAELVSGQDRQIAIDSPFPGVGDQTDASGRFAIDGLAAAHYRLVHVPDALRADVARPLRGGDDVIGGASNVRVVAGGTATISGKVVDADGRPVVGADVEATPVGGGQTARARSDTRGAFTIDEASDLVKYTIRASKQGLVPGDAQEVAPGASGLVLRIVAGLEASGRVLQKDGTPFANQRVMLALEGSDYRVSAQTDADGRFVAKALKDGVYRVEEVINVLRYGQKPTPRLCGTIRAGERDVELKMTE